MQEKRLKIEIRFRDKNAMVIKECITTSIWEISHNMTGDMIYSLMFPSYSYYNHDTIIYNNV